jgi:hypothetical protein
LLLPAVGALLMSLSTVTVAIRARTLRRGRLGADDEQSPVRTKTAAASLPAS